MSQHETWRPVARTDGAYEVSNLGRVRSWKLRFGRKPGRLAEPYVLSMPIQKRGYRSVNLTFPDGSRRLTSVHRLVCEAFHGPAPAGRNDVRHLDGDELNNLATNLAWGSRAENMQDAARHGTTMRGERSHNAKLTRAEVLEMRTRYAAGGVYQRELAKEYGISVAYVSELVNARKWAWLGESA